MGREARGFRVINRPEGVPTSRRSPLSWAGRGCRLPSVGVFLGLLMGFGVLSGCSSKTVVVQPSLPRMTISELSQNSRAVVIGTVQKAIGSTRIKEPNEREDHIYTDYDFVVEESWLGPHKAGDRIVLRLTGGEVGNLKMVVPPEYGFSGGEHTLLFLAREQGAKGEAYILTAQQGIFDLQADGTAKSRRPDQPAIQRDQIKGMIQQAVRNP